ncbi:MAG: BatD family protein [Candidatus Neomarinimicrobiota bacterium]
MVRIFLITLLLLNFTFPQEISSSISTKNISITESVIFTIKISDIDENPSVDISEIEDFFSIISGPNIGSEYRFVNGNRTSSRSISWTLIAKNHGKIVIPSLNVIIGKKTLVTNSHEILVSKQNTDQSIKDLFLEVKVSKDKAYVGEQVKLTYTFYTRIASKVLSTEFPEYNDFWVEKLFDPVGIKFTPESWDDIEIDGYNYKSLKIYEVALFPLQEGVYSLDSMIMKIETKNKDSSFNRLFWDDPFFDTFSQRTRAKLLVSDPVTIEVSPLSNIPQNFTGAVGKFTLNTSLSSSNIDEGSPTVFKVELNGEGNLSNIGRPKIIFPNEIDVFEGETKAKKNISDDFSGSIIWEYNLIPRKNGIFMIDAIEIPYFNSVTKSWSIASSKDIKLNVNKSTIFDSSDKDILSSNSNVIRYIRVGDQDWISSSEMNIQNIIFYILIISLVLFIAPFFDSSFKRLRKFINEFIKVNSALNNAIKSLESTNSIYIDGTKIIIRYFYQKNILSTKNIDISSLKNILRQKINKNDFEIISGHLDDFQAKSYSKLKGGKDVKTIVSSLKIVLNKVDVYV